MKTSWLIGLVMLFVILTVITGVMEMSYLGGAEASRLQRLMQPDVPAYTNPLGAITAYVTATWDYIQNLWGIFWFDYPFFQGSWAILRYIFMAVSIGVIVSLVAVIRGVGSA